MNARFLTVALAMALGGAPALAAVDCTVREPTLPHVCKGGANDGAPCNPVVTGLEDPLICSVSRAAEADACAGAKCTIKFVGSRGEPFRGILTILVDENVSRSDDDPDTVNDDPVVPNVIAATVILDLGRLGTLAQTFQNLPRTGDAVQDITALTDPPRDTFGVGATENVLRNEVTLHEGKEKLVNDLLFRGIDEQMAERLRTLLDVPSGKPVVTKVSSIRFTDSPDGLATVLRAKIRGAFVDTP